MVATFSGELLWKVVAHDLNAIGLIEEASKMLD